MKRQGFSLVEVLVVIVIFAVGILAMVQIYPAGLGILRTSKNNTVAINLARAQTESMKANLDQLPEAILPTKYLWSSGQWITSVDLDRLPNNLTPPATGLTQTGDLFDAFGTLGYWPLFSNTNVARRVIGEGRPVPAPRFIPYGAGTIYGGLMTLQFAPVLSPIPNPVYQSTFLVYGGDFSRRFMDDLPGAVPVRDDYTVLIDTDGQQMELPAGAYHASNPGYERQFRVSAAAVYDNGGSVSRQVFVGVVVNVPSAGAGIRPSYFTVDFGTLLSVPGMTFQYVEPDTVRVQRLYTQTNPFLTEAQVGNDDSLRTDAAYEMNLIDPHLGVLVFNPIGATFMERRARGRFPLSARVDYDVLDWRNIRDDFRIPSAGPNQQKLILDSIKVKGNRGNDFLTYTGIGIPVPDGAGGTTTSDFVILDRESGGIYAPDSYVVDKSLGIVSFIDTDGIANNGLTAHIIYAGSNTISTIDDVRGRAVRAVYQANGDFALQVMKAASIYYPTESASLGFEQTYVGGSNTTVVVDVPTRLYFPLSDVGKKVVVGEAWYSDGSGIPQVMREQEFRIEAPRAGDWGAYAYVDIREKAPTATSFDFSRGYAVRRVRGASVEVRVVWNPTTFQLTNDDTVNLDRLGTWMSQNRRVTTESFLMRGSSE